MLPGAVIAANLAAVRARMAQAARANGRPSDAARLVAVSKQHPPEAVAAALAAGQYDFGENRVHEALPKIAALAGSAARWHMIGQIQSRKAREVAAAEFALVHSVDSVRLAERLSQAAGGRRLPVLLECNISGEEAKAGFRAVTESDWVSLRTAAAQVVSLPGLEVRGLMTMAPIVPELNAARPYFARLRQWRDRLAAELPGAAWTELSMGMSDDFEAAIAEGATLVRVGRAIFGGRG
ncbi:MAG: YggS family pyridoxal phosphate-dependent enzyme [Anaerolineales bacterium]|nr:YggS family pyridoxal phosphate-dependent enzyme [Anaerolineales bacterium]